MYIHLFFKRLNQLLVMVNKKKSRRNPATRRMKKSVKSTRSRSISKRSPSKKRSVKQIALFTVLRDDHKKLKGIMNNIGGNYDDKEIMSELFMQMKEEIKIHSRAEEASVYQPMKANDDTRFLSIHAHEEHALVDHMIAELENMNVDDELWMAKFMILKHEVEHHIEHEESEMFNKLKSDFSMEELDMMAENMLTLKKEEMENTFIDSI